MSWMLLSVISSSFSAPCIIISFTMSPPMEWVTKITGLWPTPAAESFFSISEVSSLNECCAPS